MRVIEKRLRERIKDLESELQKVKTDRDAFRSDLVSNLKMAIEIHGEGKYWNMASLIERLAKQIHKKLHWYW